MEVFMNNYVVCQKKRNSPRLNVRICQEKCPLKHECKEYLTYIELSTGQKKVLVSPGNHGLALAT